MEKQWCIGSHFELIPPARTSNQKVYFRSFFRGLESPIAGNSKHFSQWKWTTMGEQAIKILRKMSGSFIKCFIFLVVFFFFFRIPVEGEVTVLARCEASSSKPISLPLQTPGVPAAAEPASSSSRTSQSSPGASWLPETSAARGGQGVRRAGRKVRAKVLPLPCRRGPFSLPVSLRPAPLHVIGVLGSVSAFIIFQCFFFFFCKLNPRFIASA